jgi:hypothetical protein
MSWPTVLVASRIAVWVHWKRLEPEIRREVRAKRHPRGVFLTATGPCGWPWVQEQARRYGLREWRRGAWRTVSMDKSIFDYSPH